MKTLLLLIAFSPTFSFLCGPPEKGEKQETLHYLIYKGDKQIGNIKAEKIERETGSVQYFISSEAEVSFLFSISLAFTFENHFGNGVLQSAFTKNIVNDKVREKSEVAKKDDHYQILRDDEQSILSRERIEYTMACLYFFEPIGRSEVFSERFGEFLKIKKLKDRVYELTLPDGKTNIYTYNNSGKCVEVQVNHFLATLHFRIK